jgi:autotransporter-associated beta strand protein
MPNAASTASASQVSVGGGLLTLNAVRTGASTFSSGSVASYQKYNFAGGYVEARIQLPTTPGSWPAFWGLYTGWPPEADVMEYPLTSNGGSSGLQNNQYNTNYHYTNSSGAAAAGAGVVTTGASLAGTWHNFGMDWTTGTSVSFYLDGAKVQSYTGSSVAQMVNMYMILDYAVGGWPGTPTTAQWPVGFSDQTRVDWVRVWQHNPNNDAPSSWAVDGGGSFTAGGNWTAGVPRYGNETAVFGRVGSAATAGISMGAWQMMGGITFNGGGDGTTAYTVGSSSNTIQLAGTTGAAVQASASSTVDQTINARLELWGNTTFRNDMTGGQVLNINGNVSGNGSLIADGVGTTVLSGGNNAYTGGTVVGSAQGPAVLRVSADAALGTGGVVIGAAGNATTARLEVAGGHTLANNIDFRGRNNGSVGIESVAGDNTLSGTISTNVGGGTYLIQSDAGSTLTLSGSAPSATATGVALQSLSSGLRTFTLRGTGDGVVSGRVQNGGGTVSVVKDGTGTWTLGGINTYSGGTSVNGGTLRVTGSIAPSSGVTVNSGGTFEAAIGQRVRALTVNGGGLATLSAAATPFALTVGDGTGGTPQLAVQSTGKVDINTNGLIVDVAAGGEAAALAGVQAAVLAAYNGGAWNGAGGLTSSRITGTNRLAVGFATPAEAPAAVTDGGGGTQFLGSPVDASAVVVQTTVAGDANLDKTVNFADLLALAKNYNMSGAYWAKGDFNYDGVVNFADLLTLARNYNQSVPSDPVPGASAAFETDMAAAFAAVPEPSLAGGLAVALLFLRRGRRTA